MLAKPEATPSIFTATPGQFSTQPPPTRRIPAPPNPPMKKYLLTLVAAALLPLAALSQTTWKSDPAHSRLGFMINHLGISEISGAFNQFEVTVTSTKPDFSDAVFQLTTEVASINTAVAMRDDHLRSPDFFDVAKHPAMTFQGKSITPAGPNRYKLSGELTIHGVTKPVTVDLWYRGTTTNQGKVTAGFQLTATLKRSDFGVGPKFPPPMIADEFTVKADGEFIRQ
jgi:polyisoprenoid-binding protein YceI